MNTVKKVWEQVKKGNAKKKKKRRIGDRGKEHLRSHSVTKRVKFKERSKNVFL